ncbi:MAG: tRNA uridine-5-carboxymethylaminomethyl(34) synthesis GTPase MnmE [Candidatus Amoebophilus sp.]
MLHQQEPIIALATPAGKSAIAVIRLSGQNVISIVNQVFKGKDLNQHPSHTIHFGTINYQGEMIDEVLIALFKAPHSFTQEDSVEISCHGSSYIIQKIMRLFMELGIRLAKPGEFTQRAFLNGRFDLIQAEAVADLIAADTAIAHKTALQQMRGGFSTQLQALREKLIHVGALLELELDFAEEDVAFADRTMLESLIQELLTIIDKLIQSFSLGNVIKNGLPIAIVGKPNAGKSTLLNALLQEERAIVSPIPGTTRDFIEAEINIGGIHCRFIDTAGLREHTTDTIESIGIARTKERMQQAGLIIYVFDLSEESLATIQNTIEGVSELGIPYIKVGNKLDAAQPDLLKALSQEDFVLISAAKKQHLGQLEARILELFRLDQLDNSDTIVVNTRHYESLVKSQNALLAVVEGIINGLSNELLMIDLKQALYHLGEITGEITTEDLLDDLFSKFCIGK